MPKIFCYAVVPVRVNRQVRIGLQKERPARWNVRVVPFQEFLIPLGVSKQIDIDRLVARQEPQCLVDVVALSGQLAYESMVGGQREVAMKYQLPDRRRKRVGKPGGRWSLHLRRKRHRLR